MRTGDLWLVAALAVTLTACSKPHAGSLPSPSPSVSAPTTASAPSSPPPQNALIAAARGYYDTLQRAAADPAASRDAVAARLDASCTCRDVLRLLDRLARDRHRLLFRVTTSEARVASAAGATGTVFLEVRQSAGREVDASCHLVSSVAATSGHYVLDLVRRDGRWLVGRITRST